MEIQSEQLGYWFLRLNGFLSTVNFVVHPGVGRNQGTDVDILGVRFPWRAEVIEDPLEDHPAFTEVRDRPYFVITSARRSRDVEWVERDLRALKALLEG